MWLGGKSVKIRRGRRSDGGGDDEGGHIASAAGVLVGRRQAMVHAISGGLAAGGVRAMLLPLDTCKTRLQLARAAGNSATPRVLFAGGARGLYRGLVPGVVGIVPAAAIYMGIYAVLKRKLLNRAPQRLHGAAVAMSAGVADFAATLVRVPCERLKQRLQAGMYTDVQAALAASRSLRVLYSGLVAQLARDIPYAATEFVVYERLRRSSAGRTNSFAVGAAAGAAAATLSNPMDVVKTRLMTQRAAAGAAGARYHGVWHALHTVAREEGPFALCKGLAPRIAAKMLQSALFFAAYESLRVHFSRAFRVQTNVVPTHEPQIH